VRLTDQTTGLTTKATNVAGVTWTSAALTLGDAYIWWVGAVGSNGAIAWDSALTFIVSI
jgi:hypothetical protein